MILFSTSFDAVFISSIVASSFHGPLQYREQKKSQGARSGEYGGCGIIRVLVLAKNSRTSNDVRMIFVLPQIRAFLADCFSQIAHYLKVIFLIDRTLGRELIMHHAPPIEENCQQNLHIRPNLACFFRSWLVRQLPLG